MIEESRISSVEVKFVDIRKNTNCDAAFWIITDTENESMVARGLDTLVVHAVNDVC